VYNFGNHLSPFLYILIALPSPVQPLVRKVMCLTLLRLRQLSNRLWLRCLSRLCLLRLTSLRLCERLLRNSWRLGLLLLLLLNLLLVRLVLLLLLQSHSRSIYRRLRGCCNWHQIRLCGSTRRSRRSICHCRSVVSYCTLGKSKS